MTADLLAPAPAWLVDGCVLPVVVWDGRPSDPLIAGVALEMHQSGDIRVYHVAEHISSAPRAYVTDIGTVYLDLARAECRTHGGIAAARLLYPGEVIVLAAVAPGRRFFGAGDLVEWGVFTWEPQDGSRWRALDGRHFPALDELNPHDDARLPDGSRRVDAMALKALMEVLCAR